MQRPSTRPSKLSESLYRQLDSYALAACAVLTLMIVLVFGASAQAQTFRRLYAFVRYATEPRYQHPCDHH